MEKRTDLIDLDRCISKIARKDRFALEELYREFRDPIYRFALMNLQDSGLAEDAMQTTFLRIMSGAELYKLGTNARAWIFSIARNVCCDMHKRKMPVIEDSVLTSVSDEYSIDDLTDSLTVKEAVGKLSWMEKEILSLYIFGGLRQTEIAKVLGISYIKVRSKYGYALKKLRKELSNYEK